MLKELGVVGVEVVRLAAQRLADRGAKATVGDPVKGRGLRGQETARELVLALRAGLEALQAFANAVLDALVIARLEVQPFDVLDLTPVAAV
jgi:hypothetical protein